MGLFLDTRGLTYAAIGICDRCSRKFPLAELMPDRNSPGLRVCKDDWDELDPYRLPARQTERITLPFVRPDVPLTSQPYGVISEDGNTFLVNESDDNYLEPEQPL
jgi:hypothetical protein